MERQRNISQRLLGVAALTGLILLVPLVAMQFTDEVVWTLGDFIVAGAVLFGIGALFVVVTQGATNLIFRVAAALGVGGTFLIIWVNLAVGLIGSGPNPGNLMYIGVLAVGIIGIFRSHFAARGLELSMYAVVIALIFHTAIALMTGMDRYPGSSMREILAVNAFLATPFVLSGLLFRYAAREGSRA